MKNKTAILALLALGLWATSCEKSNGSIGAGKFVDDRPELGKKLTFDVVSYTERWDSISVTNPAQAVLGKYQDPLFGEVNSAFGTRMLLSSQSPEFGEGTVCDSVVLRLAYNGTYGLRGDSIHLQVSTLVQPLIDSIPYYSNLDLEALIGATPNVIGSGKVILDPNEIIYIGGDSLRGTLAIYLDPTYFQEILFDASIAGEEYLVTNDDFVQAVPGLWMEDIGQGTKAAAYFDLGASGSLIQAYYRTSQDDSIPSVYTLNFGQNFGDPAAKLNYFSHQFDAASFDPEMQDTVQGEVLFYTQGGSGARGKLEFPGLDTLIGKKYSINRAELRLKVNQGTVGPYSLPSTLLLLQDNDSSFSLIKDYSSAINSTGGNVYQANLREYGYTFNVTRMVHQFVNEFEEIRPVIITPTATSTNLHRAVLGGGLHPDIPLEFNIYYTQSE